MSGTYIINSYNKMYVKNQEIYMYVYPPFTQHTFAYLERLVMQLPSLFRHLCLLKACTLHLNSVVVHLLGMAFSCLL